MFTREDGFALISVLSIVLILSMFASGLVLLARGQSHSVVLEEQRANALHAADAAIYHSLVAMTDTRPQKRWSYVHTPWEEKTPAGVTRVSVVDETGFVDLNVAEDGVLRALLEGAGVAAKDATMLVDHIRDWSDTDDLRRLNGAEANDYRGSLDNLPRNKPFDLVADLLLVKGIDQQLYDRIEPALTVHSGQLSIDPARATARTRELLKLEEQSVQAPEYILASFGGRAFRFRSEVEYGNQDKLVRQAVIRFTEDPREPYWVEAWSTMTIVNSRDGI